MALNRIYDRRYFAGFENGSRTSAQEIVPFVINLVNPTSVIDVGCGTGSWAAEFRSHGVQDVWGVDGAYVETQLLQIPAERFLIADLERPFALDRGFDLVVSLEVAEHLSPSTAETFVKTLTDLGEVVLFSAAIPDQDGTHHVNLRWQSYWVELFRNRGYQVVDCIRPRFWDNTKVDFWYSQNAFLFVTNAILARNSEIFALYSTSGAMAIDLVHPQNYINLSRRMKALRAFARTFHPLVPQPVWSRASQIAHRLGV